jgi:hypothetical protein
VALKPAYGSHIPVLTKLLSITDGPVLELGVGYFSTPLLHWLCIAHKRLLVSYDNDPKFLGLFSDFEHEYHELHLVEDWDAAEVDDRAWDIALVDHGPAYRRRVEAVRLAHCAKYIVLHDSYYKQEKHYGYKQIYPLFKYHYDYMDFRPTETAVVSNFVDLKDFSV